MLCPSEHRLGVIKKLSHKAWGHFRKPPHNQCSTVPHTEQNYYTLCIAASLSESIQLKKRFLVEYLLIWVRDVVVWQFLTKA